MLQYRAMSPEKPVALIHSYLYDRKGTGKPDRLTRTGILAAAELYRRGEIGKMVIAVEPNLAEIIEKRLHFILQNRLKEEDLVTRPNGVTTVQEIKTFVDIAEENKWTNLVEIGNHAHKPRIERIAKNFSQKIDVVTAKEVISRFPRYNNIVKEIENYPEQKSLSKQEEFFAKLVKIPVFGPFIADVLPQILPGKIALQLWMFRQLEKRS